MTPLLKRTTFVVADAQRSAERYEEIFGWSRYYDDELAVDGRFPPIAPDGSIARLIILKADDPRIGMIGFLSYCAFFPAPVADAMRIGSAVLVVETQDADSLARRARAFPDIQVMGPVSWQVPSAQGSVLTLLTVSLRDRDGLYWEASERRLP
ncbi:hypothetical protein A6F68_00123 [Tsuneonella dongtanensis]|uniref:VOC domain-containing protein n=1 Tax=Tsuneonella dongtanensis TaxID=692370 RepID=A0A1B2A923_9SPHN|nr:glyoxalase/bleomycin resistance/dioxygenase family protein [Tsuneonella dongtanensis]ANY18659.1 hypothetical protein A6F68_00123 [Tsuneonella dongtanensis]